MTLIFDDSPLLLSYECFHWLPIYCFAGVHISLFRPHRIDLGHLVVSM